jgi:hypothetical protein
MICETNDETVIKIRQLQKYFFSANFGIMQLLTEGMPLSNILVSHSEPAE